MNRLKKQEPEKMTTLDINKIPCKKCEACFLCAVSGFMWSLDCKDLKKYMSKQNSKLTNERVKKCVIN